MPGQAQAISKQTIRIKVPAMDMNDDRTDESGAAVAKPRSTVSGSANAIEVPLNQAFKISVDHLKLDSRNPRLLTAGEDEVLSDSEIIERLFVSEYLGEMLRSIAASGYIDIEPLIVTLDEADGKYTVLDGNRRLTAIRLLCEPHLARLDDMPPPSNELSSKDYSYLVPKIPIRMKATFDEVSVYRVKDRDDATPFKY